VYRRGLLAWRLASAAVVLSLVFQAGVTTPALLFPSPVAAKATGSTSRQAPAKHPPVARSVPTDRVELADKRTADSRTFDNGDGTFTTETYVAPINFDDGSGTLVPIDTTPVPSSRSGVAFETKQAAVRSEFGSHSTTGTLLKVVSGTRSIALRPISPPNLGGGGPPADRSPVIDGGRVLYSDVWTDTDLRYNLLPNGAKEDIVLNSASAPHVFAFVLDAPGLTASLLADGSIRVGTQDSGVFTLPTPFMVDSSPEADGDGVRSDGVTYSLVTVGPLTVVVVDADAAWLASPDRVFPVYLDPTTTTEVANLDTFITSAYPTSSHDAYWNPNEGGYYELWNGYYDATSGTNYAYVKTPLPTGVTVTSATFNIYAQHTYMGATPTSIYLGKLTSSFVSGQTWNMTQPSWTALTSTTVADNNWATFDVTQLTKDWIYGAATNYGVRIYEASTSQTLWKRLRASENGSNISTNKPPYLSVVWVHPSVTPTSPIASAWGKGTFAWTYSDNGSGLGQARYWVQAATSSAFTTIVADSTASSGSNTSWTYSPPTGLVTGTTYYWHVSVGDGHSWSGFSAAQTWKFDGVNPAFVSTTITGAVTDANPNYYFLGNGTATVKLRGSDANSGIKLGYQRLYNASDEDRVSHDWSVGGTNCSEYDTSTLVDVTGCSETYNSGGQREVQFTTVGKNVSSSQDLYYYFTDYAGNTLGWTDTGKNLIFDATAPTGAITSPAANATVSGSVTIVGTASDTNFTQYILDYGSGASPTSWTSIGTYTTQVTNATLGTWNAGSLATGTWTVRLRVYDKARVSSGYTTVTRTVTVDNTLPTAIVSAPVGSDLLDGTYRILGTASAATNFANYTLTYGVSCAPSTWLDIGTNPRTSQVTNAQLGTWDTTGLSGTYDLKLTVSRTGGQTSSASVCVTVGAGLGRQRQHSFETWDLGAGDELAVNVATGNPVLSHPLVSLPYRGGSLDLAATYNGQDATNIGLGPGWQLSVQRRLILNANGSVTFVDADGSRHTFTNPVTNGTVTTYSRPATLYATLVKDTSQADEFTLTYRDLSLDRFDIAGSVARLTRSQDRHANGITFVYNGSADLASATDPAGRVVTFTWNTGTSPHTLTSITDWAYIDASGVVQTSATGSHRTYRFFYDGSLNLIGWADPLNATGGCPTGGSHLTCLTYATNQLTTIIKTQTLTTFSGGTLGTTTRTLTTPLTYGGNRVASVEDAEQQAAGGLGLATSFTVESTTRVRVNRPTTTTAYGLVAAGDSYGRMQSVWRYLDTTQIERRTVWDSGFPTEPASITDNYGALLGTPARTVGYTYQAGSLGLLSRLTEPLTASTNRRTDYVYNANNDATSKAVSLDGDAQNTMTTRYCYDTSCSLTGAGLDQLNQIDNYVSGAPADDETNVTTDYTYDSYGQRTRVTRHNRNAGGTALDDRVDGFSYDANGNQAVAIVNYADGAVTGGDDVTPNATTLARTDLTTSSTFDTAGNRVSSADPRRAIEAVGGTPGANDYLTRWTFDALNQQLSEQAPVTPGGPTPPGSSSTYDELGLVRSATDFGGMVSANAFDRVGRNLQAFQQPFGQSARQTASSTYDADGHQLTAKDERQLGDGTLGQSENVYDSLGRQIAAITAAGGADESETDTGYDALNRRSSYQVGAPSGQTSTYTFDLGGRVLTTQDGFACTAEAFDYRDNALTTTTGLAPDCTAGANQRTVTHTHDGLGRLVRDEVTAGSDIGDRTTDDVLDAVGNRLQASTTKGATVTTSTFAVNPIDQVVAEARNDGSTAKTTYDPAGNAADRCLWRGTPLGICQAAGTPGWVNPPDQVTSTTSDARNQRIALTDGTTNATTTYDPAHNYQVAAIYQPSAAGRELQSLYSYDPRHRLSGISFQVCSPNGSHACTDTPAVIGSDTYAYDNADNRSQVLENNGATTSDERYCYDGRNQLTGRNTGAACSPTAADETYAYDDAGNRTQAWVGGTTTNFAYDANGQLCAIGATTCAVPNVVYDSAGRTAQDDSWIYTYDSQGRLIEVCDLVCTGTSTKVDFTYDGEGHRTAITTSIGGSSSTTTFRYQGDAIVEEATDGIVTRSYVVDDAGAVMKVIVPSGQTDAGTYLVTWNGHGDAVSLNRLNADGTLTLANAYTYSSWGMPTTTTANGIGDLGFRFLYVGRQDVQWDAAVGLFYMHARHYSPRTGRFLQPDPDAEDESLYSYAADSPITTVDPAGTYREMIATSGGGGLLTVLVYIWWGGTTVASGVVTMRVAECFVGRSIAPGWCGMWGASYGQRRPPYIPTRSPRPTVVQLRPVRGPAPDVGSTLPGGGFSFHPTKRCLSGSKLRLVLCAAAVGVPLLYYYYLQKRKGGQ
jgi:RHS repeat-associated protein